MCRGEGGCAVRSVKNHYNEHELWAIIDKNVVKRKAYGEPCLEYLKSDSWSVIGSTQFSIASERTARKMCWALACH